MDDKQKVEWIRRMGAQYPDLVRRWDMLGQAVEIDEAEARRREGRAS